MTNLGEGEELASDVGTKTFGTVRPHKGERSFQEISMLLVLKVNRQKSTSVVRRPKLKIPTVSKWLISPLVCVIIKEAEK